MKEFIDKLISRLEEEKERSYYEVTSKGVKGNGKFISYGENLASQKAISIVNQLAEEYKSSISITDYDLIIKFIESEIERTSSFAEHDTQINIMNYVQQLQEQNNNGWIPCEKELPPQPNKNPLFDNKPLELYLATVKGSEYPWRVFWNGKSFTDGWSEIDVLAWMELPKPYQPKGE